MIEDKKIFKINRIIITIFTFILFNLFIINEDPSWKFVPFLFSSISWILLLITENIVKKIINRGDRLKKKLYKFLYYIILLPFVIIIGVFGIAFIIGIIDNLSSKGTEFAELLGNALKIVFLGITMLVGLIIPYINTILFLIIRLTLKNKNNY